MTIKPKAPESSSGAASKPRPETATSSKTPPPGTPPGPIPPLFRQIDWLALALAFGAVWIVYLLTLAPELTLEDSGELVTGSFYAGIPHPPGYPVWTIYSWLWTKLLPMGSIAWRVGVGESFAAAIACGLLALLVSRGSSMFMEGIEELKGMTGKWESAICLVCGVVAGVLVGLDGFMWKESVVVNRIALFSVPWLLMVLVCLLRWIYAPHQMRYAYWAAFIFGVCMTTHQSLIVASLGFEAALAAGNLRLGRDAFLGNFVLYMVYNILTLFVGHQLFSNLEKEGLRLLFNAVGIGSLLMGVWLALRTKGLGREWKHVLIMAALWMLGVCFYFYMPISGMTNPPMQWGYPRTVEGFFHALSRGQYEQPNPTNVVADPMRFLGQLGMLFGGVAEEFTWVYMLVALVPFLFFFRMQRRERAWLISLTSMFLCLGVLLMILLNPTPDKQSADLIKVFLTSSHTIVACLIGYGLALIAAFLATHYNRFRIWGLAGGCLAVVLAISWLWDETGKYYFGPAGRINLSELPHWLGQSFLKNQHAWAIYGNMIPVCIAFAFVVALVVYRQRGPLFIALALFTAMPLYSGLTHWFNSEQRGHWFGYWFGHDMFTPPFNTPDGKSIYPEMTKDAILFGGTDPGRFCPTYTIFCESFTPHNCQPVLDQKFDRRDVYIITQNALADPTYLDYIRAHYNRSTEIDPPFFSELLRGALHDKDYQTNFLAKLVTPLDTFFTAYGDRVEKQRRTFTSWFKESDFVDLAGFAAKLKQHSDPVSQFVYEALKPATQQLLGAPGAEAKLRSALVEDLNLLLQRELEVAKSLKSKQQAKAALDYEIADGKASSSLREKEATLTKELAELQKSETPLYSAERFKSVHLSEYLTDFIHENPLSHTRIRLNRLLLEAAYPKELAHSLGGVYPDREIYIPTSDDSSRCYQEYTDDAGKRLQHDAQFPNEPRQVRPGEEVHLVGNRVQITGTYAVMNINGLITKVIFDHNPKNEFFVEESFPLDWMYPYLTPFGIIMKINRNPLPTLTPDILQRDHRFWKEYSKRFTGDIIDYDTPVKTVVDWIEKTYIRHNYNGFTGDPKFLRDSDAQKAFSKLRSAIAGIYAWRLNPMSPAEYHPKTQAELNDLLREAEFAFKQSFAICPYSPEAVQRYAILLAQFSRFDEAIMIVETCLKIDPFNAPIADLLNNLKNAKQATSQQQSAFAQARANLPALEQEFQKNPTNFQAGFDLVGACLHLDMRERATQVLEQILNSPAAGAEAVFAVARSFGQMGDAPRVELALEKLVRILPDSAEAWYDLAAFKAAYGKANEALPDLKRALDLNSRELKSGAKAADLLQTAKTDKRFDALRGNPEFEKLVPH